MMRLFNFIVKICAIRFDDSGGAILLEYFYRVFKFYGLQICDVEESMDKFGSVGRWLFDH